MLEPNQTIAPPAFCSIDELSRITGLSRRTVYARIGAGDFLARKVGSRTLIDLPSALAWVRSQPLATILPDRRANHQRAA